LSLIFKLKITYVEALLALSTIKVHMQEINSKNWYAWRVGYISYVYYMP